MPIIPLKFDPLFSEFALSSLLKNQILGMSDAINQLTDDLFLQTPAQDLVEQIIEGARLEPLTLQRDDGHSHLPQDIQNPPAFRYTIEMPYTGASGLFRHQPDTSDVDKPTITRVRPRDNHGTILVALNATEEVTTDELNAQFDAEFDRIERYTRCQARQLDAFNASLRNTAEALVHGRRDRLLNARKMAASLGYPLHQRPGAPLTYISPQVRRQLPRTLTSTFEPEPTIDQAEYENILRIIENMSFVMERNPTVFSRAPEEVIRDHYLVQLNGQYEGSATGETFNANGKTDILVREGNANLFIAECKIWHGQKHFSDAIDQLLGYVTWRDTKTAIIVFNRNQGTTSVVQTIKATINGHSAYKRGCVLESDTRLKSVFGRPDDSLRDIFVTVIVVPVPTLAEDP
jgi:hypothetical protein